MGVGVGVGVGVSVGDVSGVGFGVVPTEIRTLRILM